MKIIIIVAIIAILLFLAALYREFGRFIEDIYPELNEFFTESEDE